MDGLAALAARTERLRWDPGLADHPSSSFVLAKVVTTVNRISSDGRARLGTGWFARGREAYRFEMADGRPAADCSASSSGASSSLGGRRHARAWRLPARGPRRQAEASAASGSTADPRRSRRPPEPRAGAPACRRVQPDLRHAGGDREPCREPRRRDEGAPPLGPGGACWATRRPRRSAKRFGSPRNSATHPRSRARRPLPGWGSGPSVAPAALAATMEVCAPPGPIGWSCRSPTMSAPT